MITPVSRRIGAYEIINKLGRGGMADVYLAQHDSGQRVALKLIEHSADHDTHDAIEAERRGAKLQAQLADIDPRVVRVYDSADADGFFYVAMEYIAGQDLAELMHRGPLAIGFACDAALAVGETLDHAHNLRASVDGKEFRGIVHGDIKPKNIRIDTRGEVRVLDFGIAKALSLSRKLTRNEFGSVPYASPERLDSGEVSVLSDLWSLAVTLYEMVTGMQPYHAENTERLERMIRSRIPPPDAPDPCPPALRAILQRALVPNPAYRYPTARDLIVALADFRGVTLPLPAHAESDDTRRTVSGAASAAAFVAGADEETRRTTRADPDDQGETRRTLRADEDPTARTFGAAAVPPNAVRGVKAQLPAAFRHWGVRAAAAVGAGLFVYGAWAAVGWARLRDKGQALDRQIKAEQVTDPDEIWNKWTEVAGKNDATSWALSGLRNDVARKLVDSAGATITRYHNEGVYEKDWVAAQTELGRVLSIDPDNETARGEMRLTEGHIARINGVAHKSASQLNQAIDKFNEAGRLLPKSPDPYLGLANSYLGLNDLDKASAAFSEAEKRGYQLGKRENAQMADAYARRAAKLFADADNVRGLPQEKDEVQRAADDYQKALSLYQQILPYGNSSAQVAHLQHVLDVVQARLHTLENPAPAAPAGGQSNGNGNSLAGTIVKKLFEAAGERIAAAASANEAPVYTAGNGVSDPVPVYQPEPEYTDVARLARIQGDVLLSIEVDPSGHVVRPRVVQGLGYGLDIKALQAVSGWRFRPGTLNGRAVTVALQVRVHFRLSDN